MTKAAFLLGLLALSSAQPECVEGDDGEAICPQPAMSAIQKRVGSHQGLASEEEIEVAEGLEEAEFLTVNSSRVELVVHGDSAVKLAGSGLWVITVTDGCTTEDVHHMAEHMPEGSEAEFEGHPSEGGLCTFMMKGTRAMVMEELATHTWPGAVTVESDKEWEVIPEMPNDDDDDEALLQEEAGSVPWGLDRIDDGLDKDYHPPEATKGGEGVHIYVMDTGIRTTHQDFEGRAVPTLDTTPHPDKVCKSDDTKCAYDRQGHGTHCAGTVGGKKYGVAKKSTIHAVKVMSDSGRGSFSWLLSALDWIMSKGERPAIASMSLGARANIRSVTNAINKATAKGVAVVVAAGNSNKDACHYSPAGVSSAITVGATSRSDSRSGFSNWGKCVDIYAPGSSIQACSKSSDTASTWKSGTSMACPHVAGALALLFSQEPDAKVSAVSEKMVKAAFTGKLKGLKSGDPNKILSTGTWKHS